MSTSPGSPDPQDRGTLLIGTRRYSSWSMRGWLLVRLAGLDPTVKLIPLGQSPSAVGDASPSGLVPFLFHGGSQVWESLAIAEYCAELEPALWPETLAARTHARVLSAEMHAGFRPLRLAMPMNLGRDRPLADGIALDVQHDIDRIEQLWSDALRRFGGGGPFLFGERFGAVDAMFAPVVARLDSYQVQTGESAAAYRAAVRAHPLVREWYDEAAAEPASWQLDRYEDVA
ncbi:glutathione S-transferase N-terminal domain-containing protein [Acetobacteraceae bacterium KSS8]|uniref:Glutathione S-transferase N-terminal domain-containing protein n=1 Tax=Endosaccharibacter trunci TaxID=2812733 RepID=A0ABT1W8Y4_9PROT|nr:glutathione S-transferase N-terminal domain-containing protein [Acetobacteraceae bacterium KSS8]